MEEYLNPNPLRCDLSFVKCSPFIYYVVGMVAFLAFLFFIYASKVSKGVLLISTICHLLIFIACALVLLNLCVSQSPDMYSYIVVGIALLCTSLVVILFSK